MFFASFNHNQIFLVSANHCYVVLGADAADWPMNTRQERFLRGRDAGQRGNLA
jgi:hypothetical protein